MNKYLLFLISCLLIIVPAFAAQNEDLTTKQKQYAEKTNQLKEIQVQVDTIKPDVDKGVANYEIVNQEFKLKQDIFLKAQDANERATKNADLFTPEQLKKLSEDLEKATTELKAAESELQKATDDKKTLEDKVISLNEQKLQLEKDILGIKADLLEIELSEPVWVEGYGEIIQTNTSTATECKAMALDYALRDAKNKGWQAIVLHCNDIDQLQLLTDETKLYHKVKVTEEDTSGEYGTVKKVIVGNDIKYTVKVRVKVQSSSFVNPYRLALTDLNGQIIRVPKKSIISTMNVDDGTVYISDPAGAHILTIESGNRYQISPDNTKIVFGENPIYIENIDGTNKKKLVDGEFPVWLHDGNKIIYEINNEQKNELYIINSDSTGKKKFINESPVGFGGWSPDGQKGLLQVYNEANNNVVRIMNNHGEVLTTFKMNCLLYNLILWTPDSNKIVFEINDDEKDSHNTGFCIVNSDGTGFIELARSSMRPQMVEYFSCSSDSNKMAYICDKLLYTINADGTEKKAIADCDYTYSWSPDGKKILLLNNNQLYTINPDGTDKKEIADCEDTYAWSPDGKAIVFESNGVIFVINSDGTNLIKLCDGSNPCWSPNGYKIVFLDDDKIFTINTDGTELTQLFKAQKHLGRAEWF